MSAHWFKLVNLSPPPRKKVLLQISDTKGERTACISKDLIITNQKLTKRDKNTEIYLRGLFIMSRHAY